MKMRRRKGRPTDTVTRVEKKKKITATRDDDVDYWTQKWLGNATTRAKNAKEPWALALEDKSN